MGDDYIVQNVLNEDTTEEVDKSNSEAEAPNKSPGSYKRAYFYHHLSAEQQ